MDATENERKVITRKDMRRGGKVERRRRKKGNEGREGKKREER